MKKPYIDNTKIYVPHRVEDELNNDKNLAFAVRSLVMGYLTDMRDEGGTNLILRHAVPKDEYESHVRSLMAVHNIGKRMAHKAYKISSEVLDWTLKQQAFWREQTELKKQNEVVA